MYWISLNQQFRKRTLKGVDGCKGYSLTISYHVSRRLRLRPSLRLGQRLKLKQMQRLLRRLQKRRQCKSEQDQKRGETSSMGSSGCFNCARLPEPLRCSTDHQQQQVSHNNSISPCFIPSNTGHEGPETGSCFSLLHQRSYTLGCSMEIPWDRRTIACQYGTCHPWILLLITRCNLITVTLLDPISGHEITLPGSPISRSEYEEAPGFVLSMSHSSTPCYTAFIIFNSFQSKLLFFRKGDRDWTLLTLPWFIDSFNTFRGDLYALRLSDRLSGEARYLLAVYTTQPTPSIKKFSMDTTQLPSPKIRESFQHHLVESPNGEELLLVLQIITWDQFTFPTLGFHVFKADLSRKTWIRKETLGDRVLIITQMQTLFLPAASFGHGVKGNCIYFSTLSSTGQTPLKMFDLDSETVTDCPFSIPSNAGQFMFAPTIYMLDPQQSIELFCGRHKDQQRQYRRRYTAIKNKMISPFAKVNLLKGSQDC